MKRTHVVGLVAAALTVVVGIAAFAAHRVAGMRAPAPVAAPSPQGAEPASQQPASQPPTAEPPGPAQPVLTDAQWKARYERSRQAVAARDALEARQQRAREAAWERQQREIVAAAEPPPRASATLADSVERPEQADSAPEPAAPPPGPKKRLHVMYVFTTWCPHCDRMLPAVQALARRPNVVVTGICADSAEAYDLWRRDHRDAGFTVRQMSREDARREIARFGGSYAGPVPFVAAKSGSTLVYDRSGAPQPASLLLDRLAEHM